jgi:hypothetical protein
MYSLLSDLVMAVHFGWIVFLLGGLVLALKWPLTALFHLAGLVFALIINLTGWYCPLTDLEIYLAEKAAGGSVEGGPFLTRLLEKLIYPELDEGLVRVAAVIWCLLNLAGYALLARRLRSSKSAKI